MTPAAFFTAIRDEPHVPLHRLAYADWCDEAGDAARAEAVRLGVEVSRRDRWDWEAPLLAARGRRLARAHEAAWRAADGLVEQEWCGFTYAGGLPLATGMRSEGPIEQLPLPAPVTTLVARGDGRFLAHPDLRHLTELLWLTVTSAAPEDELAACGGLDRLTSLAMNTPTGWRRLVGAPLIQRLHSLSINVSQMEALPAQRPERLRKLSLWGSATAAMMCPLEAEAWHGLTDLQLNSLSGYTPSDALLASRALRSVEVLDLRQGVGGIDITPVFGNRGLTRLRALRAMHREGVPDVGQDAELPALEHLNLSSSWQLDAFLPALARSRIAPQLKSLVLRGCQGLRADAARVLAGGDFRSLRHLDLGITSIRSEGLAELFDAPWMAGLTSLSVASIGLRPEDAALFDRPALSGLRVLDLRGNGLEDDGVAALVSSPHLAQLRSLDLRGTHPKRDGIAALAVAPMRENLEVLALGGDEWIGAADPVPLAGRLPRLNELLWERAGPAAQLRLRSAFGPAAVTFAVTYNDGV